MNTRLLTLTVLAALAIQGASVHTQQAPASSTAVVPGEVVIAYEAWASTATKGRARGQVRAALKRALRAGQDGQLEVATLPPGLSVQAAINALSGVAGVQYAEPNWLYTHEATSNDP